mmetsp:Transcript_32944/g.75363  ORF Transcript_32944/g.75363 Transcript_32944/m.75363 type:complete len:160 (-) Transcript_32944:62-541(-)
MYDCVVRGDLSSVFIASHSTIMDKTVITTSDKVGTGFRPNVEIGRHVVVGHNCHLRSCVIQDNAQIGDGAIVLEGSVVEKYSILEPGSVVPPGRRIPASQVWGGVPVRFIRDRDHEEEFNATAIAAEYGRINQLHKTEWAFDTMIHVEAEKEEAKFPTA